MNAEERLIITIKQLRIARCILKLTELKKDSNGWIFRTEVTNMINVDYNTLQDFLEKLEKKGAITYLKNLAKPEWQGGVFKVTENGKRRMAEELKELV